MIALNIMIYRLSPKRDFQDAAAELRNEKYMRTEEKLIGDQKHDTNINDNKNDNSKGMELCHD